MPYDRDNVLQALRYELAFVQQGGYSGSAESMKSPFCSSTTCLNNQDPLHRHACRECVLWEFVPENARESDVPCHQIPISDGFTVQNFWDARDSDGLTAALELWLKNTIERFEAER